MPSLWHPYGETRPDLGFAGVDLPIRKPCTMRTVRCVAALSRVLAACAFAISCASSLAAQTTVNGPSSLQRALGQALGGETFELAPGEYGSLVLDAGFTQAVTLQSAERHGARFADVLIGGGRVTLNGLRIDGSFRVEQARGIELWNSLLTAQAEFVRSEEIVARGNDMRTLSIESSTDFTLDGNLIHRTDHDLLRVMGPSATGRITNNVLWDMIPRHFADGSYTHADAIQFFGRETGTPHDIVIRGNLIYDDSRTGDGGNLWGQGIFLSDAGADGYRDFVIEENLIAVGSPNSIFFKDATGGRNIRIANNTIRPWPDGDGGWIRLIGDSRGVTVERNVAAGIESEGGADLAGNFLFSKAVSARTHPLQLFAGSGDGATWQDFLPRAGSPIDLSYGLGATTRLHALQEAAAAR
ncbi:right-handed parallel beta-helix repeat-containing protein [Roseivivax marinus]|uniref:right-handed parallel beta-helix repeat-containing protein n=1 Tax=Roseivivax marinus TaxID=1379903 RepID=UPI001F03D750|nr:right-handed parallel beta-helix repeat-containing protein [Roseivivax marinus]UMA63305.1 right-handed parallel beta-helix repeat-containing protein [Roseivivax marinus]